MNRFAFLTNRLKEIILAAKIANQVPSDKQKDPAPLEPEK